MDIRTNPVFIREKDFHRKHCEGGYSISINKFTGEMIEKRCPYCERIERYRKMKKLEAMGGADGSKKA